MVKVVGHAVTVDPKIFIDSWLCKSLVVANKGFHIGKLQVIKEKQYRAKNEIKMKYFLNLCLTFVTIRYIMYLCGENGKTNANIFSPF